ncbi:Dph6-related ATP pyrophosphatase [[Clostridium] colinum]|uniref:Dph6-related ATP pyrophosphatase n=1 Tax=[Clostridium] colinum TaxID=36835 RepID=UPI002025A3F1|nr:diphthine--ammonia ligase [[Clostridium] colinum]
MIKEQLKGKKFVASYSGGKDSMLSIYRAIKAGLKPVCLIITYNKDKNVSWFHGVPKGVLDSVSNSLDIPVWLIETTGEEYAKNFETALTRAKQEGAEVCIFGDIDLQGHFDWCSERCENVGLEACFPLWLEDRKKLVYEFLESGFTSTFTVINTKLLDDRFLGMTMTKEVCEEIEKEGADVCGENGEYHTFASDGPIFKEKVKFKLGDKIEDKGYSILPILEED